MKENKKDQVDQKNIENAKSIYNAKDGLEYCVTSTPELGILRSLGIIRDAIISKQKTYKLGGPVLLMVESSEIAIGKDIAKDIMVRG